MVAKSWWAHVMAATAAVMARTGGGGLLVAMAVGLLVKVSSAEDCTVHSNLFGY